jgi:hypothetical protein
MTGLVVLFGGCEEAVLGPNPDAADAMVGMCTPLSLQLELSPPGQIISF